MLASPDIPAETLLSSRGNFLASSLVRFKEAYLLSNEGDEVLRQISTLANYFMYPTNSRNHGFRLGNVEILSREYGVIDVPEEDLLGALRIGELTLQELYAALEDAAAERQKEAEKIAPQTAASQPQRTPKAPLPRIFTYFDCTDYVEPTPSGRLKGILTSAKRVKGTDRAAGLRWYSHLGLLRAYIWNQKPNVHGGYFDGALTRQLIFRLACLGYTDTVVAFGGEREMSEACAQKQIRVLISPILREKGSAASKSTI